MKRAAGIIGALAGLFVVVLVALAASASAQTPALPSVSIASTTPMSETDQCMTEPTFSPGSFTLDRSDATGTLDVTYEISGGPTDLNADVAGANHTVTFADGQTQVTVAVHPALGGTDAKVQVLGGEAYDAGDPAVATITKTVAAAQCATPSTSPAPTAPTAPTATEPETLARTGSTLTVALVVLGLGMIVAGMGIKRMSRSRLP